MCLRSSGFFFFFFFNDTATTEIYTLSLHDALPISRRRPGPVLAAAPPWAGETSRRSEEHTSELQSPKDLVCRLLLEKKKQLPNCVGFHKENTHNSNQQHRPLTI